MSHPRKLSIVLAVAFLTISACGSSDDGGDAGGQGGSAIASPAQMQADQKAAAVAELSPVGWSVSTDRVLPGDDDDTLTGCAAESSFDLTTIDDVTAGYADVSLAGSSDAGVEASQEGAASFEAGVQIRVFDTVASATSAHGSLLEILQTPTGRDCLADSIESSFAGSFPEGTTFEVVESSFPGADASVTVTLSVETEALSTQIEIIFATKRDGACTLVATYLGIDGQFPSGLATALFAAGIIPAESP